jgi:anthranilate synthase component 2
MFLLIDNYDSFTYNLWHFLGQLGAEVKVVRNDKITVPGALALKPEGIIISPGPCDPDKAGICLDLIKACPIDMPVFGVCLGHQCIGQAFKAKIIKGTYPMHGKLSRIQHANLDIFADIPQNFLATRYHSLMVDKLNLPNSLTVSAKTQDDIIMGISHKTRPIFGVQFHPESIASEYGYTLLANFLKIAGFKVQSAEKITVLEDILRKTA